MFRASKFVSIYLSYRYKVLKIREDFSLSPPIPFHTLLSPNQMLVSVDQDSPGK